MEKGLNNFVYNCIYTN